MPFIKPFFMTSGSSSNPNISNLNAERKTQYINEVLSKSSLDISNSEYL